MVLLARSAHSATALAGSGPGAVGKLNHSRAVSLAGCNTRRLNRGV
jgi:hypothetical protein